MASSKVQNSLGQSNLELSPWNPRSWFLSKRYWWVPIFLIHELVLLAATFFPLMSHPAVQHRQGYFWFQWDSLNYINIGQLGYTHLPGIFKYKEVAFFPFVPVLVRIFTPWGVLVLEQVVFILVLLLLKSFGERMGLNRGQAVAAAWLFALNPAAIFYSSIYAEPWTLFTTLVSLFFAVRKRWLAAAIVAAMTSLTQGTGILAGLFPLMFFILSIAQHDYKTARGSLVWGLGSAVGLAVYMLYLGKTYHNPLMFSTVQTTLWHAHWTWPWQPFLQELHTGGLGRHHRLRFAYEGIAAIYALGALMMWTLKGSHKTANTSTTNTSTTSTSTTSTSEQIGAKLYVTAGLLVSFSFYSGGQPFHSTIRIASMFFPLYIGLAKYLPKWVIVIVLLAFSAVVYAGTSLFTYGYFFQ
ncbi:mannosyltransferase family protein [Alicyclobacillus sp. SO9]|uniref:mannosyltransferase family protein n=1 Tax=Alicyclobacillus sp. SO9 TaxID=2665646 RepID=UPI0018E8A200|nr:mannosyltransferase family protein [Alicyclobacillus sp. SO9]QQE79063.1 hypothetical protein GI364_00615 [Alicyclobacillus sp. SO9]